MGRRFIGITWSLIWTKTLMKLIFNPCGEFEWSVEGPVSQIHFLHLQVGAPGIFSDLLRSVQMLKSGVWKAMRSYCTYSTLVKQQPWLQSLHWKICLWQTCSLGSGACSEGPVLGQNTLMMMSFYSDSLSFLLATKSKCPLVDGPSHFPSGYDPIK